MKYLLDTNALLYLLAAPDKLSARAAQVVRWETDIAVSIASLWEIAIKKSIGKLQIALKISDVERECENRQIQILSIDTRSLDGLVVLPRIHSDPFDRKSIAANPPRTAAGCFTPSAHTSPPPNPPRRTPTGGSPTTSPPMRTLRLTRVAFSVCARATSTRTTPTLAA